MPVAPVDYEAVLADLKAELLERPHWGQRQLLAKVAELEGRHRIELTVYERFLRRFGGHVFDVVRDVVDVGDDADVTPPPGASGPIAELAASSTSMAGGPDHRSTVGGHDGSRNRTAHAGAAAGA